MKNISLKTQTLILIISMVLLASVPLIFCFLGASQSLSSLGTDPRIERSLERSIDLASSQDEKQRNAEALKRYNQIKVLKNRIVRQVTLFSVIYSIIIIIISIITGYYFVTRITRPLVRLTEATKELARGKADVRIQEDSGGEVGVLVHSFNRMADDLKTAHRQREIAERRATWQHVARTIAHEITNPLTPIKLSTERMYEKFLMESRDFPEVIKSTTSTILNEIANLQKLVDTFHKYAKFPDPVFSPVSLTGVIRETSGLFTRPDIKIVCAFEDNSALVNIDKGQISEAIANLLKNAIEAIEAANRTDGEVTVGCEQNDKDIRISIMDNGCGIAKEDQERLFQPYFTTKTHGNGIGLALTERIVALNGGSISFESEQGKGTVFNIVFPLTKEGRGNG